MPKISYKPLPKSQHVINLKDELAKRQDASASSNSNKQWSRVMAKPVQIFDRPAEPIKSEARPAKERKVPKEPKAEKAIREPIKLDLRLELNLWQHFYSFCVILGKSIFSIGKLYFAPVSAVKKIFAEKPKADPIKSETRADKKETKKRVKVEPAPALPAPAPSPIIRISPVRSAFAFTVILLLLAALLKGTVLFAAVSQAKDRVVRNVADSLSSLAGASKAAADKDFLNATRSLSEAKQGFVGAQQELSSINDLLLKLAGAAPSPELKLAGNSKAILAAAESASSLGQNLTQAISYFTADFASTTDLAAKLENINVQARAAADNSRLLNQELNSIDMQAIPDGLHNQFIFIRNKSNDLYKSLEELSNLSDAANLFLGLNQDRRYLLIFQNNAEARATGGFFGSFALIDFSKGKIKKIETPGGGSYDTDAGLRERIIAPEPLQLVNAQWHFWDSNWWPDWPTSAKKIAWFYEKSAGPSVDGVISFTPTVMEELLRAVGPIDMTAQYGVTIDADNFWDVTQEFSEQKPDVTKTPKKIIGDLMNQLLAEIPKRMNKEISLKLLALADKELSERQILLYFFNDELENTVQRFGWDGRVKATNWDYLSVINSNIAGGKSDRRIRQTFTHNAVLQPDGTIIDEVKIKREHTAGNREPFAGVRNVDWMRVYVPHGSQLLEATGFETPSSTFFDKPDDTWEHDPSLAAEEQAQVDPMSGTKIYDEAGKTVFANWSMIDPGQTEEITLRYRLPFTIKNATKEQTWQDELDNFMGWTQANYYPYSLLVQKQSGSLNTTLISKFEIQSPTAGRPKLKVAQTQPRSSGQTTIGWSGEQSLDTDYYQAAFLTDY
ncbi:DUF4012 domain-containing protein [Candidatus Falkowbacteria bacterium]|nr:DUF4012 domain-containing protein [Candidatus Falkowbacteria bacterium]